MKTSRTVFVVYALMCYISKTQAKNVSSDEWSNAVDHIVGGEVAVEIVPYLVSLNHHEYGHFCGGSIISARHVVSAAHCFHVARPPKITVVSGTLFNNKGGERRTGVALVTHSQYHRTSHDIAVLKVDPPFDFSQPTTQPIPLGTEPVGGNVVVKVTGWGLTKLNPIVRSDELQVLLQRTMCYQQCKKISKNIDETTLCVTGPKHQSTCIGDSGGPIVREFQNRTELVAIVSHSSHQCTYPGLHARVSVLASFVTDAMKNKIP